MSPGPDTSSIGVNDDVTDSNDLHLGLVRRSHRLCCFICLCESNTAACSIAFNY